MLLVLWLFCYRARSSEKPGRIGYKQAIYFSLKALLCLSDVVNSIHLCSLHLVTKHNKTLPPV